MVGTWFNLPWYEWMLLVLATGFCWGLGNCVAARVCGASWRRTEKE